MDDYNRAYRLLEKEGNLTPQQFVDHRALQGKPITKSRYYTVKAGYQYVLAQRITAQLREGKALRESGEDAAAVEAFASVITDAEKLAAQEPDYGKSRYRNNEPPAHKMPFHQDRGENGKVSLKKGKGNNSKRTPLGPLNKAHPDWAEKMFEASSPTHHRTAIALLHTTGCRLKELENGLTLSDKDGQLEIKIVGAKTGQGYGQEERILSFEPKNLFERTVYEAVKGQQNLTWKLKTTQRAFHKAYTKAVRVALGTRWAGKVSPYSHRHQFSADLKAAGLEPEAIALALGHSSTQTQHHYGMAKQGSAGGRGLEHVQGTQKVKDKESVQIRMEDRQIQDPDAELFADLDGTTEETEQDRGMDLDLW